MAEPEPRSTKLPWIITIGGFVCGIVFVIYTATRPRAAPAPVEPPGNAFVGSAQSHEVTWSELDPWLAEHPELARPVRPAGDASARAVTGIAYATALAYCQSIQATLAENQLADVGFRCHR